MNQIFLMSAPEGGGGSTTLILWGAVFLVFYLFMIRPQMTKQKKQTKFREAVGKGENIVTTGGIHGKIVEAVEGKSSVIIQTEGGAKFRLERSAISEEFTKAVYQVEEAKDKKKK